jgi:signal transduction histidine kinase
MRPHYGEPSDDFVDVDVETPSDRQPTFARGTQELNRLDLPPRSETERRRDEHLVQIAHDLKAPLATIALEVALLGRKLERNEGVVARPLLERISHNVEFLDRMVHDLLEGCSLSETGCTLARAPTDLRVLLQTVIERSVCSRDRSRVLLDAPSSVIVQIDDLRIQRVVANLLSNALSYTPVGSAVVVRLHVDPEHYRVDVIDSGPGLTAEEAGYIFDKYRRTDAARTREGSGLGLYVSKQIVEAHGGRIGVESGPGAGSRFFFELPRSPHEGASE